MKKLLFLSVVLILSGCTSITQQTFSLADPKLLDPDKALVIVKRKREQSRSVVQVEVFDNGQSVGKSGVLRQPGQLNNWLIWERNPGEMNLVTNPGRQGPITEVVEAGKQYKYLISDTFLGLKMEKL